VILPASSIVRTFEANNRTSQAHAQRAQAAVPTGMSRSLLRHSPFASFTSDAKGVWTTDLDGNRRIDFHGNYAALIHGHGHPVILDAVTQQLAHGTAYSTPAGQELRLANHLKERVSSIDRVLFNNSGTEAVLVALRAARALTGRNRIAKFEGGYHGFSDFVMVGGHALPPVSSPIGVSIAQPDTAGLPLAAQQDVVLIRYNDISAVREAMRRYGHELAAVVIEPMLGSGGVIPAKPDFLAAVREETARAGVMLICDEVITLRLAYGGLQSHYGLEPDFTTMAKIIGGGFPIGAVGGRADAMSVFEDCSGDRQVFNLGTFSANPVSVTAGFAALQLLDPAAMTHLSSLGDRARDGLQAVIDRRGLRAAVTGLGSMFQLHWTDQAPTDSRGVEAADSDLKILTFLGLANRGIQTSMRGMCCLSTPMDPSHIDHLVNAFDDTVAELIEDGWSSRLLRRSSS